MIAFSSGSWFTPGVGLLYFASLPLLCPWLPCDWPALPLVSIGSCWRKWGYSLPPCLQLWLVRGLRRLPWFSSGCWIRSCPGEMFVASLRGQLVLLWSGPGRMSSICCTGSYRIESLQGTDLYQIPVCRRYGRAWSIRPARLLLWQSPRTRQAYR